MRIDRRTEAEPRKVRSGNEDVYHSPIAAVQNVLQRPVPVAVEHTVEYRRYDEQQRQRDAVDEADEELGARLAAPQQLQGSADGGQHPQAVCGHVGQMLVLGVQFIYKQG